MKLYKNEKIVILLFLLLLVPVLVFWNLNNPFLLTQDLWYYGTGYHGEMIVQKLDVDYTWWEGSLFIIGSWLIILCFMVAYVHLLEKDKQKKVAR